MITTFEVVKTEGPWGPPGPPRGSQRPGEAILGILGKSHFSDFRPDPSGGLPIPSWQGLKGSGEELKGSGEELKGSGKN